jgi:PKD repeat protein
VEGAEIGWTGGQPKTEPKCTIGFNKPPTVAAGGSEMVFMFDAAAARVVEFGPGGSGCASATATAPQATVSGKPVSVVPVGTKVTLSSTVTQANALSVEWEFGDGTKAETVSTPEYQNTTVEHAFAQGGKLTIKETIHTDNLTTPTLTEEGTINVTAPPPTALFSVRTAVTVGEAVGFDGTASHPNGAPSLKEYRWKFGDGSEATTKTAETTHSYAQAGEYTVELVVVDSLSQSSEAYTQQIKVNPPVLPPPVEKQPPPVEKQAPPPPPPPPPPVPDAELASSLLTSSPSGAVGVKLTCPAGESSCSGTVTLRTLGAVSARSGGRSKKKGKAAILTLATGSFTVAGGQVASVTLHLSAKARALLARLHSLRAQATIVAHDPAGAAHTTQTIVTLRAPKAAHRRGHQHH